MAGSAAKLVADDNVKSLSVIRAGSGEFVGLGVGARNGRAVFPPLIRILGRSVLLDRERARQTLRNGLWLGIFGYNDIPQGVEKVASVIAGRNEDGIRNGTIGVSTIDE